MDNQGYMPKEDQLPIVDKWLQRQQLADDVEFLKEKGGIDFIIKGLKTDVENGIDPNSVETRRELFGTGKIDVDPPASICELFIEALKDLTLIVLIVAAFLSIAISMATEEDHREIAWIEGVAILGAVVISALVQAINDHQKEKQFQELNEEAEANKKVNVIRNGEIKGVSLDEIVAGDVCDITSGMELPGDGIVIDGFNVEADESAMTGEPDGVLKASIFFCHNKMQEIIDEGRANLVGHHEVPSPVLVSGTKISNGTGRMVIFMVGKDSSIGKIKDTVDSNKKDTTPLQDKLETIAEDIGKFGLMAAVLTMMIQVLRVMITYGQNKKWSNNETSDIIDGILVAITVLVVAIPEGLPLAVTLSLAFSVKKMLLDKNLVRKLHACETMGGANIICSDKTGTLTRNEMFQTHFWNFRSYDIFEPKNNKTTPYSEWINHTCHSLFEENIACNSISDPVKGEGTATELATVKYLLQCGINSVEFKKKHKIIHIEPFNSERKRMSTIIEKADGKHRLYIKGASEYIVECCNQILDLDKNEVKPQDEKIMEEVQKAIVTYAKKSLRTIGMAYVDLPDTYDKETKDKKKCLQIELSGLTLIGVCGIKDIIRAEVPDAVLKCNRAGISVKMVTGDNKVTARAIAKEVNILEENDEDLTKIMEGPEFQRLTGGVVCKNCKDNKEKGYKNCDCVKNTDELKKSENKGKQVKVDTILYGEEFDKIWQRLAVLARSRPEDKYALVVGLRERGNVVAVTGDGTNDAPALSKADVGFAMGIAGTEVAKQAAAIMLMDDNFTSIVSAVKWGRNIYDSIRKFLMFQLTVNVVAVTITFVSAASTKEAILSAIQMLWINLIMDTLASLALATEPPTEKLLQRKPHPRDSYIVNLKMAKHIIGQSIYQGIVMMIVYFAGTKMLIAEIDNTQMQTDSNLVVSGLNIDGYDESSQGASTHLTYCFNIFVMMQIFNFLNARKLEDEINIFEGMKLTSYFTVIVIVIFFLQVLILSCGNIAFRCATWGLGIIGWLVSIAFGMGSLVVSVLQKMIPEDKLCSKKGAANVKANSKINSLSVRRLGNSKGGSGKVSPNNSGNFDQQAK